MKNCAKCREQKAVTEFYRSKIGYIGSYCKPCMRQYCDAWKRGHPKATKKSRAKSYAAHRDKEKSDVARWRLDNPNARAKHYAANPEKYKALVAKFRAENPEYVKLYRQKYLSEHPGAKRIWDNNRRSRKRENGGRLSQGLAEKLFTLQKGRCPCCGLPLGNDYHLDHKMPLALGGANEDWNMQLLRRHCNNQKYAKHPVDFMRSRGFLL